MVAWMCLCHASEEHASEETAQVREVHRRPTITKT
jgi:hypothetical protein